VTVWHQSDLKRVRCDNAWHDLAGAALTRQHFRWPIASWLTHKNATILTAVQKMQPIAIQQTSLRLWCIVSMGWDYGMGTQCPAAQHHNIDGCWIVNRNSRVQASTVRDFVHRQQWCHLLMYDLALTANPNYVSLMRFRPSQCLISCRVILHYTCTFSLNQTDIAILTEIRFKSGKSFGAIILSFYFFPF
jgi:hypothetical protein